MSDYANDVLVSADWASEHLDEFQDDDSDLRLVEVDVDTEAYDEAHAPGAIGFNWETDLQDQTTRDILSKDEFEATMGAAGISEDDTVVLYGDNSNWFAAYTYWQFKYYGHDDVKLRATTNSKSSTASTASTATPRPSPTAVSASAPRSRGSRSTSCWATTTPSTTTAPGPSGATSSARPSRKGTRRSRPH